MQKRAHQFRPSLAHTIHIGVLLLLLLLGVMIWLAMPLMNGIVDKARETRDIHLPAITQWRHNSQRADRLYYFINTLYRTEDPALIRRTRLQSQVLVNGFAFEPDPQLAKQASSVMQAILPLSERRTEQHRLQQLLHTDARALRQISEQLALPHQAQISAGPQASAISRSLFVLATNIEHTNLLTADWAGLIEEIERTRQQTSQSPLTFASSAGASSDTLGQLLARLQERTVDIIQLQIQAEGYYQEAIREQLHLSNLLNNDAALKTQQLAKRVEDDALQVQHLTWVFIAAFLVIGTALLIGFNYLVLRPILRTSEALELASRGIPLSDEDKKLGYFSEINAIAENIQHYSETSMELRHLNEELEKLSHLDGLTGIANRRQFDTCLQQELNRATRHQQTLALILFDIDHFKQINDAYGHQQGDDCLRAFAHLLKRFAQRSGELAARYGGEEFALILPQIGLSEAQAIAEQIRVEAPELSIQSKQGELINLNISAGVAYFDYGDLCTDSELLQKADSALYRAKQAGRNQVATSPGGPPDAYIT
ncbi:GGDEF domain-containing protein [Marinobacterium sp. YM272]|uniref:GGDEF domain-containing protein n=1 Tax=Marinobacterium sp. YM272 TaxID=3421654 RepID=UPI003D7F8D70